MRQINIVLHLSRCRVALRPAVLSAARIWPSVSRYLGISFGLRGAFPQVLPPSVGLGSSSGTVGIFGNVRRVWATALRPDPPKMALCNTWPLGGACIKYRRSLYIHTSLQLKDSSFKAQEVVTQIYFEGNMAPSKDLFIERIVKYISMMLSKFQSSTYF